MWKELGVPSANQINSSFKIYFNTKCGCFQKKVFPELFKHRMQMINNSRHRFTKLNTTKTLGNLLLLTNVSVILIRLRLILKPPTTS